MVVDRLGNGAALSLRGRVQPSNPALQLRELADHLGGQVAFGQQGGSRGALAVPRIEIQCVGEAPCGLDIAPRLVPIAADGSLEGDVLQVLRPLRQRAPLIEVPEEPGVVEPSAEHSLVTGADLAAMVAVGIGHRDEAGGHPPARVLDSEVLLVDEHHRLEHFLRKREIALVELPQDGGRVLGFVHQRLEEPGILPQPAAVREDAFGSCENPPASLLRGEDHSVLPQRLHVAVRPADMQRARPKPAMPPSRVPRPDAGDLERNHLAGQQRHDPADRADEPGAALAFPVHAAREPQRQDHLRQTLGQQLARLSPDNRATQHQFAVSAGLQLAHGDSRPLREADPGAGGIAGGVKGDLAGRPSERVDPILLLGWNPFREERQPSGRGLDRHTGVPGQPEIPQAVEEQALQIATGPRDHPRRDLLGPDF